MASQNTLPSTSQKTTAPVAAATSPSPSPQQPIPHRHKWLPFILIIAIPLVFLAYRLIDTALHSPETVWKFQRSQAESKQAQAKADAEKALTEAVAVVQKQAENTQDASGKPLALELTGEKFVDHGCQAVTIMAGDKMNRSPVGRLMYCVYAVAQAVKIPSGQTKLSDLVAAANSSQGTQIEVSSSSNEDKRPKLGLVTYASDAYASEPLVGYGADWEHIYQQQWPEYALKVGSKASVIYTVATYHIFFDQDL